jgi:tetratricopeptide (TPR) repeat protein
MRGISVCEPALIKAAAICEHDARTATATELETLCSDVHMLGNTAKELKNYPLAERFYKILAEREPSANVDLRTGRYLHADILLDLNRFREAAAELDAIAANLDPRMTAVDVADLAWVQGVARFQQGDAAAAIPFFQKSQLAGPLIHRQIRCEFEIFSLIRCECNDLAQKKFEEYLRVYKPAMASSRTSTLASILTVPNTSKTTSRQGRKEDKK